MACPRTVPAVTIDEVCQQRNLSGPYVIKLDIQGAELEALMGAGRVLDDTELVILEASFFAFFKGGPQIYDVFTFMKQRGLVLYDILDLSYRRLGWGYVAG